MAEILSSVNTIKETRMAKMIASSDAEFRVMFPTVTAMTAVTTAMLSVWPMERLVEADGRRHAVIFLIQHRT